MDIRGAACGLRLRYDCENCRVAHDREDQLGQDSWKEFEKFGRYLCGEPLVEPKPYFIYHPERAAPPPPDPVIKIKIIERVPERVFVTKYGERFHTDPKCRGMRSARQVFDRDACALCACNTAQPRE